MPFFLDAHIALLTDRLQELRDSLTSSEMTEGDQRRIKSQIQVAVQALLLAIEVDQGRNGSGKPVGNSH